MNLFEVIQDLPSSVSAYGWVPFVVVILLSLLFSSIYVRHFWNQSDRRHRSSACITMFGMAIAVLSASLLPVDVFLVSFMKNEDGSFKEWATNATRQTIENSVTFTYYSLYGIIFFYTFFVLPLAYFSYEERDDDYGNSVNVFPTALLYTIIFLALISGLLIAGAFIPYKTAPPQNSTEWAKIEFMVREIYKNRGKDAIAFVVNVLTIYGMFNLIVYTSVGLASFPITMVKGFLSLADEELNISKSHAAVLAKINNLRNKQSIKSLSSREIAALADLEEEQNLLSRRNSLLDSQKKSFTHKCSFFSRIFSVIFGTAGILFSLVLFVSLLIANIDKLMNSLGYRMGYVLKENVLPNPLDYIMVQAQRIFPLDYVIFFFIVIFLLICTVSGIRYLGVCCLCIPMYKIRPGRTPPQGLIMLSFVLMFAVLAFNILLFSVLPTYTTFGSQYYCKPPNTTDLTTNTTCDLKHCTLDASADDCVMTRSAAFVLSFAFKAWVFAATYYWLTWGFLLAFIISFIYILVRQRRSSLAEAIDKDDFEDSDDNIVRI